MSQARELTMEDDSASKLSLRSILMWLCAAVFYFYQFVLRVSPSVMTEELQNFLSIEACGLGILASFYYYGYVGGQIPVGLTLDRIGVRKPLVFACALCLIGCLMFVYGGNLMIMSLGRLLMGIGSAFGFLSVLKLVTLWLPFQHYSMFVGLSLLLGTTGAVSAGAPLSFIIDTIGWQETILYLAAASGILAVLVYIVVRDHDEHQKSDDGKREPREYNIIEGMLSVLKVPQTYIVGMYGFLMYIPLSGFADLWGVPYIREVFNVDKATAAGAVSTFYVGIGVGAPLCALVADYFKSQVKPMIYGAILTAVFVAMALYCTAIPFYLSYVLFFLAGAASSVQFLAFATITAINPSSISGTATGIHNMWCMLSGVLAQPLIGYIIDLFASRGEASLPGVQYASNDYKLAMLVVPISLLASVLFAMLIKETYDTGRLE